jgi:hypothetical protein
MTAQIETALTGSRDNAIVALITARTWRDAEYKARFLQNPREILAEEGIELPSDVEVRVVEDSDTVKYVTLSRDTTEAIEVLDLMAQAIPVPEGCEVRLVQSTDSTRYIALKKAPLDLDPTVASEHELARAANHVVWAVEAVVAGTTVSVVAEATAAVVLT